MLTEAALRSSAEPISSAIPMNTPAKIEYATNNAIKTYHPRFIETVSTVVNHDYSYFFTSSNNVQSQLTSIWGG